MVSMKRSRKILLFAAFALLACLVVLGWQLLRPERRDVASVTDTFQSPSFEVSVEKPRTDRAFFGILPTKVEAKLFGVGELRFDQASRGAQVGSVAPNHLELSADGWDLLIETDGEGRITQGTRLVFPIEIAEKLWTLRCRPADRATGYLNANTRAGSNMLRWPLPRRARPLRGCQDGEDPRHGSRGESGPRVAVSTTYDQREFRRCATRPRLGCV